MSTDEVKSTVQIDSSNVDELKENGSKSLLSCDSGVETFDTCSSAYMLSSDSDGSPIKCAEILQDALENQDDRPDSSAPENDASSEISTPTSLSSDDKVDSNLLNFVESSCNVSPKIECPVQENKFTCDDSVTIQNIKQIGNKDVNNDKIEHIDSMNTRNFYISNLNNDNSLTNSTLSLNESNERSKKLDLPLHSCSAENISHEFIINNAKEIDKDQILSEFTNQKSKVSATQKIVPDIPQALDMRYSRLPKELLSQDLGSIVKNVHGIFSTVSGSLKNVYNNSHRVATPKPPVKIMKPVTNGKILNEIFEDIQEEKPVNDPKTIENANIITESVTLNEIDENSDNSKSDMLKLQIESLERVLFEQRKENASLRERVKQQVDELEAKDQTFKELEAKVDLV